LKFVQVTWERRREQPTSLFLKNTVILKLREVSLELKRCD